jgi:hypothetical protein
MKKNIEVCSVVMLCFLLIAGIFGSCESWGTREWNAFSAGISGSTTNSDGQIKVTFIN